MFILRKRGSFPGYILEMSIIIVWMDFVPGSELLLRRVLRS